MLPRSCWKSHLAKSSGILKWMNCLGQMLEIFAEAFCPHQRIIGTGFIGGVSEPMCWAGRKSLSRLSGCCHDLQAPWVCVRFDDSEENVVRSSQHSSTVV